MKSQQSTAKHSKTDLLIEIVSTIALIVVIAWCIKLAKENENLKHALRKYAIANGTNYAKETKDLNYYRATEDITGVNSKLLLAVAINENSDTYYDFGIKRIPQSIMSTCAPEFWQQRAFARIAAQEMCKFIFSNSELEGCYLRRLGKRYSADKEWPKTVEKIYNSFEKGGRVK